MLQIVVSEPMCLYLCMNLPASVCVLVISAFFYLLYSMCVCACKETCTVFYVHVWTAFVPGRVRF